MKLVITGGAGFIGGYVTSLAQERGHEVSVLDHRLDGVDLAGMSCPELAARFRRADVVVHLAARVGRANCEKNPGSAVRLNTFLTTLVAEACREANVPLVYTSTSEVYGDHGGEVVREGTMPMPSSGIYGMSKLWAEHAARHILKPFDLLIMRPIMAYGPGMPVGPGWAALPTFLHNALHGEPITVHRGARRSWCYVTDMADAIIFLLESGYRGTINVGRDDEEIEMLDVARRACSMVGAPLSLIEEVDAPPLQTVVKCISTERLRGQGWKPSVSIEQGMRMTLDAMRS